MYNAINMNFNFLSYNLVKKLAPLTKLIEDKHRLANRTIYIYI